MDSGQVAQLKCRLATKIGRRSRPVMNRRRRNLVYGRAQRRGWKIGTELWGLLLILGEQEGSAIQLGGSN